MEGAAGSLRAVATDVSVAAVYAQRLLADLPQAPGRPRRAMDSAAPHWAVRNARCGVTALTGFGRPMHCPVPLAAAADGTLAALRSLPRANALPQTLDGGALLTERAVLRRLRRQGVVAPGGGCRLLDAADGLLALQLSRAEDWSLLPALLCNDEPIAEGDWQTVATELRERPVAAMVERARLLGLAAAAEAGDSAVPEYWSRVTAHGPAAPMPRMPLVVDLSNLWAGPLAAQLLRQLGAQVVKLESRQRPDGGRAGDTAFFDRMQHGKAAVAIDWQDARDRERLRRLLLRADVVIEGARPRALQQIGIDAGALVQARPGLTWVSITGYGRGTPQQDWVAYGDDAAVAAGLARVMRLASGRSCFVADAIADPLTGLHAALAAWAYRQAGGGVLLDVPLAGVVRHVITATDTPEDAAGLRAHVDEARAACAAARVRHGLPPAPAAVPPAPALGADNARLALWQAC